MKNCNDCKYSKERFCVIPLYVNGERFSGRIITDPEKGCDLYDQKESHGGNDGESR